MKWFGILALIVLAQQPAKPPEGKRVPEHASSQISQQPESANPNQNTPVSNGTPTASTPNSKNNAPTLDENIEIQRKLVLFTGLLVVAGFATAAVVFWQSWETRRSAKAAFLNAQALINGERAWIMVEIGPVPGMGEHVHPLVGTKIQESKEIHTTSVRVLCRNEGKVPAWITERRVGVMVTSALPDFPRFDSTQTVNCEPEPVPSGKDAQPWDATVFGEGAEDEGQITIVYGIVRYRDAFSDGHSTTFGYVLRYKQSASRIEGKPKYNENT